MRRRAALRSRCTSAVKVGDPLAGGAHVSFLPPLGMNRTPLGLQTLLREKRPRDIPAETDLLTGRQFREAYLVPLSESETLLESVHTQTAVLQVGRSS